MGKFKKQYIIPYYETHKSGRVTPISLLKYLGETSGDHSDYNDIGIDELRKITMVGYYINGKQGLNTTLRQKIK